MTKVFEVDGLIIVEAGFLPKKLVVRYSSDQIGKSLSIADDKEGVMFQVPFDEIYEKIKEA